jgi:hypothetical protein
MAIDPRITMGIRVPDAGSVIGTFNRNMQNNEEQKRIAEMQPLRVQQAEQTTELNQQAIDAGNAQANDMADQRKLKSFNDFAIGNQSIIDNAVNTGDATQLQSALVKRRAQLVQDDLSTAETDEAITMLGQGNIQGVVSALSDSVKLYNQSSGQGQSQVSIKSSAPIINPDTGQLSIPTFNPNTNTTELLPVEGAFQETPTQKQDREVKAASVKKRAELKETRTSQIKTELGDRNRSAARSQRPLKQALKLAQTATQGLSGSAKLQLSRLIPGIDSTNEAALDATLKQLALEQLQQFKGPTTDFEFGVTQSIAGDLGNSKEANTARIKSLDRNNWFNQREFKQFQNHVGSGGDPDTFSFNFGEPIKTKKGVFTLQDIQDTAVDNNLTIEETLQRLNR